MNRNECYENYWAKHPEEEKLWLKTEPYLVGFQYGIQSEEYTNALKPFHPDNPTILYNMYEHYIVNKQITSAQKYLDRLKELYPEYGEAWWFVSEHLDCFKEDIEKCENKKKVQNISEFLNGSGREEQ